MSLSLTELRANLYRIVDQLIETGIPVEIERKGVTVKLVLLQKKSKFDKLGKHPKVIRGNPEDLVHIDWSNEWDEKDLL